ncbi:alpha/beta hydrolase [Sporolactobacillus putidus]|uniref:Phospholipase n=1 Tax=Sporolactobacillus putidus TaxID=492735 RepID=A0A917W1K2_9BACL|nr:phospholipase [Sporolactobacillus putidus]GGL51535.1 phospholipase [Sporolactobacillus putidus]
MSCLYKIKRPDTITNATPILVTLHGMGSNYHDLTSIASNDPADFVQINIQGNIAFRSGFTYYVPDFSVRSEEEVITKTLSDIDRFLIDTLKKERLSAEQPLFFLGFSQGAILSLSYSLLYPDKTAGAVVLNGRLPKFISEAEKKTHGQRKPSFFLAQGEFDPIFPLAVGRSLYTYLKEGNFETDYHEYRAGHEVTADEVIDIRRWLRTQFKP